MAPTKRRYSKEGFARRGDELVASKVRPHLTAADEDKFVAIDIETGEYELDKNEMRAVGRLRKRIPDPQIWLVHVTRGYLHRFGGHGLRKEKRKRKEDVARFGSRTPARVGVKTTR